MYASELIRFQMQEQQLVQSSDGLKFSPSVRWPELEAEQGITPGSCDPVRWLRYPEASAEYQGNVQTVWEQAYSDTGAPGGLPSGSARNSSLGEAEDDEESEQPQQLQQEQEQPQQQQPVAAADDGDWQDPEVTHEAMARSVLLQQANLLAHTAHALKQGFEGQVAEIQQLEKYYTTGKQPSPPRQSTPQQQLTADAPSDAAQADRQPMTTEDVHHLQIRLVVSSAHGISCRSICGTNTPAPIVLSMFWLQLMLYQALAHATAALSA